MQQCDQILDLRPLQQRGVADDQRRQARPFEFLGELCHVRLASEQHRHMRGIGGGRGGVVLPVPCDGLFGEACHGIDFLAEGGKSQHADRTFRRGGMRSGSVRLLAALSTMQVLRRVTLSGYGFASEGMPKSFWNMRNAPGLAPRHA